MESSLKLSETKVGLSTETMDVHTPTNHLDSETLTTLASFGNMADAIVQMNNLLQNEREASNNLRIENAQLKAKIGELEPYKVNGKN